MEEKKLTERIFGSSELQRAWDSTHKAKPAPPETDENLVAFSINIERFAPKGAPVLDAGCGRGRNTHFLSRRGFITYGCDISLTAVTITKELLEVADLQPLCHVSNLRRLPYPDESFEAAVCVRVLPYNLKAMIEEIIDELWRVLKIGGWLYLDMLHNDDSEYGQGTKLEEHTFLYTDGDVPMHFSSREELDWMFRSFSIKRLSRHEFTGGPSPRVGWIIWGVK